MRAKIIDNGKTKKYHYITLLVADKKLEDFRLNHLWNYGVDCKKDGEEISIRLRKEL